MRSVGTVWLVSPSGRRGVEWLALQLGGGRWLGVPPLPVPLLDRTHDTRESVAAQWVCILGHASSASLFQRPGGRMAASSYTSTISARAASVNTPRGPAEVGGHVLKDSSRLRPVPGPVQVAGWPDALSYRQR